MKAVHFGAGSIGRGFIADLLHDSGYEITLVDVNAQLNKQINQTHSYHLYVIEEKYQEKTIDRVKALSPVDEAAEVIQEIVSANILTTAVWADNLPKVAPMISEGLHQRFLQSKERINVLACENAMFNSEILKKEILKLGQLTEDQLEQVATFPNTAVDRMVLEDERAGEKVINIGVDFELVIERTKLADPTSLPIKGTEYTDHLVKYIERKLYIINCGHAWSGYMGAIKGYTLMSDIFADEQLVEATREVMGESADLLAKKYGFTKEDLDSYIDFAIRRFQTPGVVDTVSRVCRSPIRKLEPNERLVGPANQCEENQLKNDHLLEGIAAVFLFDDSEDQQSKELLAYVEEHGISDAVSHYTELPPEGSMHQAIVQKYQQLQKQKGER
ncbi:mannitol-1-phosphate 5-dehydrogenase [Enterococcus florum]|uniref:Mannitol-1-phosphate 5-dehydrogenase n=1 Tax=Enterococcus florum TaxID=2480627 RepID=A0A4P5P6E0_9ENTE|nr:mannitol-1-phosphate 5-dehydrogenase [Enterococcus florum]GCF93475.1 mannitol-1-phosphate 5-dehydrogenase [Enterococcus florum]